MLRGFLIILLVAIAMTGSSQQCLTHHLSSKRSWDQQRSTFTAKSSLVSIPVVVHVVWNTPSENIPSATIMTMIDQLNTDFNKLNADTSNIRPVFANLIADANVEFCLASADPAGNTTTGITRTFTNDTWFDPMSEPDDMKSVPDGNAPWDPLSYLNIWICDISSGAGANIVNGYTYLPQTGVHGTAVDGIVLDYDNGLGPTFRTITHEAGHYFGLQHPWGNGGCMNDDGITDTPNTDGETTTCSNDTLMRCNELTQYENFMDFSPCRAMFTTGQSTLMDSILTNVRGSLLNSDGCDMVMSIDDPTGSEVRIEYLSGQIIIEGIPHNGETSLIDILGREMASQRGSGQTIFLSTTSIVPGPYFLRITDTTGRAVQVRHIHVH